MSVIWFVASYYFILQPKYNIPQVDVHQGDTPFVADDENSYLEEQKDGTYIFYYGKYSDYSKKEPIFADRLSINEKKCFYIV